MGERLSAPGKDHSLSVGVTCFCFFLALLPTLAPATESPEVGSGSTDLETSVKAADILNFARFVEWPVQSGSAVALRICVIGRGDLGATLRESLKGKSIGGRTVTVVSVVASNAANCCEILLIDRSEAKHTREILQVLGGKPVLTVSDDPNGFRAGVMIAFRLDGETVRFQINQEAADKAGLKISSQLMKVAIASADTR